MSDPGAYFIAAGMVEKQMLKSLELKRIIGEAHLEAIEPSLAGRMVGRVKVLFQERSVVQVLGHETAEACAA